jgi:putative chitinase
MNAEQFQKIMPRAPGQFLDLLNSAMAEFVIDAKQDQAAFLATLGHESAQLTVFSENLNYGAAGLQATWPARFNAELALAYARQPERIANRVYASRGGNGDEASGDGWRFRGAGAIQLTFHDNQAACAEYFGIPVAQIGDWLRTPTGACRSAGWFWMVHRVSAYAVAGDFDGVCDMVNRGKKTAAVGDAIGYPQRLAMYQLALEVL